MDEGHLRLVSSLARRLPWPDASKLSHAAERGPDALMRLRGNSSNYRVRAACEQLSTAIREGADCRLVSGALLGAADACRHDRGTVGVDVVWTGPDSRATPTRLTSAVIASALFGAESEILLVGYAVQNEESVAQALHDAAVRGVDITLLLERETDNPRYSGTGMAFPKLAARRLAWPASKRSSGGASLHAKVLVVDRGLALVGSANITAWALERNLECGVLVRGGDQPRAIHDHIDGLVASGCLQVILPS